MRKIWILMLLVFMTLLSSQTFWYLESKVYCNLENKNVTIFTKNEEWTVKRQTYLDTLYQLALKKYNEHHNDHQLQIIENFTNAGYILNLKDISHLEKLIEKAKTFKPKKYVSNTENMVKLVDELITS